MVRPGGSRLLLEKAVQYLDLAFLSICGSLAREGLNKLTDFEYGGVLWANVAGCFLMGLHPSILTKRMSIVFASGFCGSLTSMSTLITTLFALSATPTSSWGNNGYSVMAFLAYLIIQIQCSWASFKFGQSVGGFLAPHNKLEKKKVHRTRREEVEELADGEKVPMPDFRALGWIDAVVLSLTAFAGVLAWVAVLVLAITIKKGREWTLTAVFSPPAAWLRFYTTRYNQKQLKFGTAGVNISATLIACVLNILASPSIAGTTLQQNVIAGLINGFCGTLSTVSTWILEITTMEKIAAYKYATFTIAVCFCIAVVVEGSYKWTR